MECSSNKVDTMVASLQSRRKALESKITEKNRELKRLCIQEAELTGSLPPEIPLDPGETPPTFRRRVGTSFTYPENLINKLKFKDDETLASLELEYKIQKGIAEAALGLANDETANKSVRRKHRMMYQQSQSRIIELETRINLCNNQKVKKKPRPESSYTTDFVNNLSVTDGTFVVPKEPNVQSLNPKAVSNKSNLRQSQSYNKFPGQRNSHDPRIGNGIHNLWNTHEHIPSSNMQPMLLPRSTISLDKEHVTHPKDNGVFFNNNSNSTNLPSSHELSSKIIDQDFTSKYRDRFGSLDRRHTRSSSSRSNSSVDHEPSTIPVMPRHTNSQHPTTTILLPNQMYPENSLMRTHSLGNIKNENQQQIEKAFTDSNQISLSESRKNSEKKWVETSLDSSSVESGPTLTHDLPPPIKMHSPPIQPENHPLPYDPLVPFESPKNHTVVQVGKWQPYREVTKPFEMSDFYKYSTRFRKPSANSNSAAPEVVQTTANPSPTPSLPPPIPALQNKGIYQPLKPHNCHPLVPQNVSLMEETVCPVDSFEPNNELCLDESVFANEMLSWYQDEATPQSRTATLV
ncbi:FERM domain-containing protein 4B isoform X2 [Melanaphis sacchari]|uniref:FERM domain-containing protein 4B isoform X2 n=1 Tax=Melanaphis sacchari TaxID=742174 RepID=UPI000DC137A8|nr:FERM domain-containing protein 4B isoform X2 [Melanaphis sacchari]